MDKNQAIKWCESHLCKWPNSAKYKYPEGWRWVVCNYPYQKPLFKLINAKSEEILEKDVIL